MHQAGGFGVSKYKGSLTPCRILCVMYVCFALPCKMPRRAPCLSLCVVSTAPGVKTRLDKLLHAAAVLLTHSPWSLPQYGLDMLMVEETDIHYRVTDKTKSASLICHFSRLRLPPIFW